MASSLRVNKINMKSRVILALGFYSVLVALVSAQSTWTGSINNDWNNAGNWSPSGVPGSGDNVIINSGTVSLNTTPVGDIGSLTMNGGDLTIGVSLTISGASNIGGGATLDVGADLILNAALVVDGQLIFGDNSISGVGDLTINGTFNWNSSSATLQGPGSRTNSGTINMTGALLQTTLTNDGTLNQSGTQTFILGNGGRYVNNGTHDFQNDRDINENDPGNLGFTNNGSVIKSGGTARSDILVDYDGSGSVEAQAGSIEFRSNSTQTGTLTSNGGSIKFPTSNHSFSGVSIGGSGSTEINGGTISIDTDVSATNILFSSGLIVGPSNLTISGTMDWTGGTYGNTVDAGQLIISGNLNLNGGDKLETTMTNDGTITWSGGSWTFNSNAVLINNGTMTIETDQDILPQGGPQSIQNNGTWEKTMGSSTTVIHPVFDNDGDVSVAIGEMRFFEGTNSSTMSAATGAILDFSGSSTYTNNGTIGGSGTIGIGGPLDQNGTLSPGSSPGILTFTGGPNFSSTSDIVIELGGNTVGTEYDQVDISGTVSLDGSLTASLISGFVPSAADTFNVVKFGTQTGQLTNTVAADLDSLVLEIIEDAGFIKLVTIYKNTIDTSICSGESIFLEGANQTMAGTYFDTLTSTLGVDSIVVTNLTINALPTVVANASSTSIMAGESVTLTGSGAVSYTWDQGVTDGVAFVPTATATYTVTGTDAGGCMNSDQVVVTVTNTSNNPPTVATPISDQQTNEDESFNLTIATDAFTDPDVGDVLTYTATLSDDSTLPNWLSFDATSRTFTGTPTNDDVGNITIKVTATDSQSESVSDEFELEVINVNDAPTVVNVIPDQSTDEDQPFTFAFDADVFVDVDAGDALSYTSELIDGSSLPMWLNFDASSRTFSGTPVREDVGVEDIRVIATDGSGATASTDFSLEVLFVLGLSEALQEAIHFYPNPVAEIMTIELQHDFVGVFEFQILDVAGRKIFTERLHKTKRDQHFKLNLDLEPGPYLLRLKVGDAEAVKRMIRK